MQELHGSSPVLNECDPCFSHSHSTRCYFRWRSMLSSRETKKDTRTSWGGWVNCCQGWVSEVRETQLSRSSQRGGCEIFVPLSLFVLQFSRSQRSGCLCVPTKCEFDCDNNKNRQSRGEERAECVCISALCASRLAAAWLRQSLTPARHSRGIMLFAIE